MKTIMTLRIIIISILILFISTFEARTQEVRELRSLDLQDFECLKSLDCAQNSPILKNKGWAFVFEEPVAPFAREFTASMKGEDVHFHARYNQQGDLLSARYKRNNVKLPKCLLIHLTEDADEHWQIAESELDMKNFDPALIRYRVKLQNHTTETYEEYDYEKIRELHNRYEGSSELCLLN